MRNNDDDGDETSEGEDDESWCQWCGEEFDFSTEELEDITWKCCRYHRVLECEREEGRDTPDSLPTRVSIVSQLTPFIRPTTNTPSTTGAEESAETMETNRDQFLDMIKSDI